MELENISPLHTDYYELVMAQGYFLTGRWERRAVFDLSFRSLPFGGGYAIFAGIGQAARQLTGMRFAASDIDYLRGIGFDQRFLKYLGGFSFGADLYACREGEVVFADEPVVRVEGNLIEAQLAETLLLNCINFQTLVATKAARISHASGGKPVIDFGLRRAPGVGGTQASRAAFVGGVEATSNVLAAMLYQIPVAGTQAHSWVQSYESELEAFRAFARVAPDNCVLLVDTYDTLRSGVPNAIRVAREMASRKEKLRGIRLDSGDPARLARVARVMLDEAGLAEVGIVVSNRLDEYAIENLEAQGAPINAYGVGTRLVAGGPDAALDGVYKLAELDGRPCLKLSEDRGKINNPGRKGIWRYLNNEGQFQVDGICLAEEKGVGVVRDPSVAGAPLSTVGLKCENLLKPVLRKGGTLRDRPSLKQAAEYCRGRLRLLPESHRRLSGPDRYKVGLSSALHDLKCSLVERRGMGAVARD